LILLALLYFKRKLHAIVKFLDNYLILLALLYFKPLADIC